MVLRKGLCAARSTGAICLLVAASGCGVEEPIAPSPRRAAGAALPSASPEGLGPYAVGVTTIEAPDPGDGRALPIEVWYPALPEAGAPVASYVLSVGALELADVPSPLGAVRDAVTDLRGAPHPVVVFSHGFGGVRFQSVYLTEFLATHGFVVAAPDHVGNTFRELIATANAVPAAVAARLRPEDVSRTLDVLLERADDPDDALWLTSDPERVGVAGHSFGAFTALRIAGATIDVAAAAATCLADPGALTCDGWADADVPASARDDRFIAALPQAPGGADVVGTGFASVAVPTMIQGGTLDQTTPFAEEAAAPYASLPSPAMLLAIDGAGHFTFSDMCALVETIGLTGDEFDDGCGEQNIDPAAAHALADRYATAFLQVHVAGDATFATWLDPGAVAPEGVASFEVK